MDDTKLDKAEEKAIGFMKGYLSSRYDVDQIFNKTGSDRDPVVLMYAVEIAIYYLHQAIDWRQIPIFRKERYDAAKEWLKDVQNGVSNPNLPVPANGDKSYIMHGSNPKRDYQL